MPESIADGMGFDIGIGVGQNIDKPLSAASVKAASCICALSRVRSRYLQQVLFSGQAVPGLQTLSFVRAAASGAWHQTWGGLY